MVKHMQELGRLASLRKHTQLYTWMYCHGPMADVSEKTPGHVLNNVLGIAFSQVYSRGFATNIADNILYKINITILQYSTIIILQLGTAILHPFGGNEVLLSITNVMPSYWTYLTVSTYQILHCLVHGFGEANILKMEHVLHQPEFRQCVSRGISANLVLVCHAGKEELEEKVNGKGGGRGR